MNYANLIQFSFFQFSEPISLLQTCCRAGVCSTTTVPYQICNGISLVFLLWWCFSRGDKSSCCRVSCPITFCLRCCWNNLIIFLTPLKCLMGQNMLVCQVQWLLVSCITLWFWYEVQTQIIFIGPETLIWIFSKTLPSIVQDDVRHVSLPAL